MEKPSHVDCYAGLSVTACKSLGTDEWCSKRSHGQYSQYARKKRESECVL